VIGREDLGCVRIAGAGDTVTKDTKVDASRGACSRATDIREEPEEVYRFDDGG